MRFFYTVFLSVLLLVSIGLFFVVLFGLRQGTPSFSVEYQQDQKMIQDSYTILLAGDVMLDRGVGLRVAQYGDGNWRFPWRLVANRLSRADVVFVNHEGVMSDVGQDTGGVYSFNFPIAALGGLLFAGVDVVSLANNHIFDWGGVALCDTRRRLINNGIGVVGAGCDYTEANAPYTHSFSDGSSVGFLAYTPFYYPDGSAGAGYPGVSDYSLGNMRERVAALREQVDVVIVSMHWGEEYQSLSNSEQRRVGRMLVAVGADVVVGHHPHTIQEVEEYNGGWIIYSLGNFIFDQYFSEETMEGLVAIVTMRGGMIESLDTEKVFLNRYFQPAFESQD